MPAPHVRFILHKSRNPKNIGAAARGMANFGFRHLAVVQPYSVAWRETRSAVHASEVVLKAKNYDSLATAIRSYHVVVGTSAATRRTTDAQWIGLEELRTLVHAAVAEGKSVAVMFGSEKSGLSNDDLAYCRYVVRIPTAPDCPSMNLAQAVAVLAFAIRPPEAPSVALPMPERAVSVEHAERLVQQALKAFTNAGLLKGWDPARSERRIRKAFHRWNLSEVDVAMLHGIFRWVITATGKKEKGVRPFFRHPRAQ
jgi:tRNA/rRNA methyltransferase